MKLFKRYIKVVTLCDEKGNLQPIFILWGSDNRKYKVDRILETRKASSSVGGCGILYRCLIDGKERSLYYEINRWFIESSHP